MRLPPRSQPEPPAATPPGPRRVRVEGDLFHGRVPEGAVYVGRAAPGLPASPYANPFPASGRGAEEAVRLYRRYLAEHPRLAAAARRDLAGKDLACWCREGAPCHGDVLLDLSSGGESA